MKVMFGIAASDYPRLEVTPEYAVMHAKANASMYVDNGDLVFTLALVKVTIPCWTTYHCLKYYNRVFKPMRMYT